MDHRWREYAWILEKGSSDLYGILEFPCASNWTSAQLYQDIYYNVPRMWIHKIVSLLRFRKYWTNNTPTIWISKEYKYNINYPGPLAHSLYHPKEFLYLKYLAHRRARWTQISSYCIWTLFIFICRILPKTWFVNGKITYNRSPTNARYPKWTRAYYKCNTGYNLTSLCGPRRRVCSSSGKWDRDWDPMWCVKGNEWHLILIHVGEKACNWDRFVSLH